MDAMSFDLIQIGKHKHSTIILVSFFRVYKYDKATERFILLDWTGTELYSVPRELNGIRYGFRWVMNSGCFWRSVTKDNVTRYQLMNIQNGQVLSVTEPIFEAVDFSCFPDGFYWNDETKLADDPLPVRINGKCGFQH